MKKTRTQYSIINMLTGVVGFFISTAAAYVCRMIFVRCLSGTYLGLTSLLTNFLSMLSLAELGIGGAITYSLYKPIADNDEDKIASLMRVFKIAYRVIGCIVAVAGMAAIPFLRFIIGDSYTIPENIYVVYGIFLFNTASSYFFSFRSTLIYAYQEGYINTGISYAVAVFQNIVQIVLLLVYPSYIPYLIVMSISVWTTNILITVYAKKKYPFAEKKHVSPLAKAEKWKIIKNVKAITAYKISGLLVNNTDNIVITYFGGLAVTGVASNYSLIITMINSLLTNVFNSQTASIGNLNATEGIEKRYHIFNTANLANFWAFGWAAIGIAFVSSDFIAVCFGSQYVMTIDIPIMLAVNLYMVGMQNTVWTYKNTMGLFKYGQYILFVTAAINILGDIILGKLLGVFGIFLATAVARLVTNTWYEPYALFKHGFGMSPFIYLKRYLMFLSIIIMTGGLCWISCTFINFGPLLNFFIKLIICSLIPNIVFILVFRKSSEYAYLKNVASRVFRSLLTKLKGLGKARRKSDNA